jgi:hypothetical protein
MGLFTPGLSEYPEVGPDSKERTDTSAQEMENLVDIVRLEKFMQCIVDHLDLLYAPSYFQTQDRRIPAHCWAIPENE